MGKWNAMIRTINNLIRTLLFQAHLPPTFWVEALHMAAHLLNILPSTAINNEIPHTRLYKTTPNYADLRVFGCLCYPHVHTNHKLEPRATPSIFLGYPTNHRGYRCLDLNTDKIILSRHVTFDETVFPYGSMTPDASPPYNFLDTDPNLIQKHMLHNMPTVGSSPVAATRQPTSPSPQPTSTSAHSTGPPTNQPTNHSTLQPTPSAPTNPTPTTNLPPTNSIPPTPPPVPSPATTQPNRNPASTHSMVTRYRVGTNRPTQRYTLSVSTISPIPKSYNHAFQDPHWYRAMLDEYNALIKNNTWILVPRPSDANIVRSLWLFRHKYNADGTLNRYKARLVANGSTQLTGIDVDETFSPVVKPATIRTVLSLALSRHWPVHQLDVKNAFLHGSLSETVYMQQPPGFRDSQHPDHVCLLQRSLYGLKQAPRAWFQRFAAYAARVGFIHSRCDTSLFIYRRGSDTAYLLLYVDDIILTASSTAFLQSIIATLHAEFSMTDLGPLNYFLGISVTRNTSGMFLSQQKYASELLERAGMLTCNPCRTPVDTDSKLSADGDPVSDPTLYRSLAGALQYLTFTRPDISYAVQQVCLYMHDPREPHFSALKRILRYIRGTMPYGLQLFSSTTSSLVAYSDADWAGCPTTRRSTSGYCVFLGNNLLSWSSKRQVTLSRSSAEAEYRGVANAVAETCWLRNLLRELHTPLSTATLVYCDNVSAVYLSSNPVQHQRTKHIEIDIHFVRDLVAAGHIRVLHVPSRYQYADIFTKGLPTVLFDEFRSSLSVRSSPAQTAGGCIETYKDDERVEQGKRISNELIKSIEDSKFFIIVFSKNYASSSWCLDELVQIMECHKTTNHITYPVFYDVEPSEVRKQSGAVGKAFAKHKKEEVAGKWRQALEEAANMAGWELKNTTHGYEAKFVNKIVEKISLELRSINLNNDEDLIGMEPRKNEIVSDLGTNAHGVRMIGIKGMGGGGKTTLARASLQKQVLSDVLKNQRITISSVHEGKNMLKMKLRNRKVLIVLDDVDHKDQLEALAREPNWFKEGSRIIITTRDEQVLVAHGVKWILNVNLLSDKEALLLFSRYAFGRDIPIQGYEKPSPKVVRYASGLPLTIKVLGSFLCGKDRLEWKDALRRLKTIPLKETLEKLELSYIGLEDDYKEIFLDVACLMKSWPKENAIRMLESCGFHARNGLRVLEQKSFISFITIDDNDYQCLAMHDHIEEMGKNIVRRLHPDEPNKHSRLWIDEEIIVANDLGNEATRCMQFSMEEFSPYLLMKGLGNMKRLRVLHVHSRGSDYLSSGWKLDQLEMRGSNITQLWEGRERKFLKNSDLHGCHHLIELHVPIGCLKRLVYLDIGGGLRFGCFEFNKLPETLEVSSLTELHMIMEPLDICPLHVESSSPKFRFSCFYKEKLPSSTGNVEKLLFLGFCACRNLKRFSQIICGLQHLRKLILEGSIHKAPTDLGRLESLEELTFLCKHIKHLPDSICMLKHLKSLELEFCYQLQNLPENLGHLECLEKLIMFSTEIRHIPDSICMLKHLKALQLEYCWRLESLPDDLGQLECLEKLHLLSTRLKHLPDSVCTLKHLKSLKLESCLHFEKLPVDLGQLDSLEHLILADCRSLEDVPIHDCPIPVALPNGMTQRLMLTASNVSECSKVLLMVRKYEYVDGQLNLWCHYCEKEGYNSSWSQAHTIQLVLKFSLFQYSLQRMRTSVDNEVLEHMMKY
ncbi:ribonuclease H-like domain-containing protein [Tanacetum coccineum]|uniref:Ribonuclease H-like domain-containing protein n=2 Tax=Tanacetum coccineum TaxID=301880 RepID=A0ABQ4WPA7_9ASTR